MRGHLEGYRLKKAEKQFHRVPHWVYDPNTRKFGPSKFVGYRGMNFAHYDTACAEPPGTVVGFHGAITKSANEQVTGDRQYRTKHNHFYLLFVRRLLRRTIKEVGFANSDPVVKHERRWCAGSVAPEPSSLVRPLSFWRETTNDKERSLPSNPALRRSCDVA